MKSKINIKELSRIYDELIPSYEKLGINLKQAIELFLKEKRITYLSISDRIKEKSSFIEKVERKKYDVPFEEVEDICGIRIICYYQSDVDNVSMIIKKEFDIIESQSKEDLLKTDQFGYRSTHLIVKIKKEWLKAPNYRGLENLKAEIQIRTVLMHAWAEIEHKLAYKKESHIPKEYRRKLFRMSAKLEETDEQFEELKNKIEENQLSLIKKAKNQDNIFDKNLDLNLDNLQAFLDFAFPKRQKHIELTAGLLDELLEYDISMKDLITNYEKVNKHILKIEEEVFSTLQLKSSWAQVGVIRHILDLTNDNYYNNRGLFDETTGILEKWRQIIKNA